MTEQHTLSVKSSDGTHLHVVETGNPDPVVAKAIRVPSLDRRNRTL